MRKCLSIVGALVNLLRHPYRVARGALSRGDSSGSGRILNMTLSGGRVTYGIALLLVWLMTGRGVTVVLVRVLLNGPAGLLLGLIGLNVVLCV
jgi:hypothetical protein